MSSDQPLYRKALLAWQDELEKQYKAILEDKQSSLRNGFLKKLREMFGPSHAIEVEGENDPNDMALSAVIEGLRFLSFRTPAGNINIVFVMRCPRCGHQMPSAPLTRLADLGRELTNLAMSGSLSNHECSVGSE
jgi:hypothetical protein